MEDKWAFVKGAISGVVFAMIFVALMVVGIAWIMLQIGGRVG
jgi:heme/copper-type cytochrome/quinol oxidase subunit 4